MSLNMLGEVRFGHKIQLFHEKYTKYLFNSDTDSERLIIIYNVWRFTVPLPSIVYATIITFMLTFTGFRESCSIHDLSEAF